MDYQYDVALSFAGEDRKHAEALFEVLKKLGYRVFYDRAEKARLWGVDQIAELANVYKTSSRYCIVFVSKHYVNKRWTKHELQHALERRFNNDPSYLLPIRLDESRLDGLPDTVGYLSIEEGTEAIAKEFSVKCRPSNDPSHTVSSEGFSSFSFFHERMCQAFPGQRGIYKTLVVNEIQHRLSLLLSEPLRPRPGWESPIWMMYGDGGSSAVDRFALVDDQHTLIRISRLRINELIANIAPNCEHSFVLLKFVEDECTGLYPTTSQNSEQWPETVHIYNAEEYGVDSNGQLYTRAEYDDGYALRNGRKVDLSEVALQVRYLESGVICLVPQESQFHQASDEPWMEWAKRFINGKNSIDNLSEIVRLSNSAR